MKLDVTLEEFSLIQEGLFELQFKRVWQLNNKLVAQAQAEQKTHQNETENNKKTENIKFAKAE